MVLSCSLVPFCDVIVSDFPEKIQANFTFFFFEAVSLINTNIIFSIDLLVEMNIFEIFSEELAHHSIVIVILSEILYDLLSFLEFVLRVKPNHFLEENLGH